ncbi:hypothetical protein Aau02nite_76510 [Amorphoplanes auranticolor]|uniref:Uncharacterized protein n=1 Tax=Actinoplanes auranticolor TaxID=47988 RepID=A0A919SV17_9ACTN|nr:hypothetical protein Aau02nite_76510 [Actinoplanes auranticolor]
MARRLAVGLEDGQHACVDLAGLVLVGVTAVQGASAMWFRPGVNRCLPDMTSGGTLPVTDPPGMT